MNYRALEALKGSIRKWEKIVAGTEGDEGTHNCPLCQEFYRQECVGCPVYERTGHAACDGSPYQDWASEKWTWGIKAETPEDKLQAQKMLDFLKSLLPSE